VTVGSSAILKAVGHSVPYGLKSKLQIDKSVLGRKTRYWEDNESLVLQSNAASILTDDKIFQKSSVKLFVLVA
jgi:hypothetical protein